MKILHRLSRKTVQSKLFMLSFLVFHHSSNVPFNSFVTSPRPQSSCLYFFKSFKKSYHSSVLDIIAESAYSLLKCFTFASCQNYYVVRRCNLKYYSLFRTVLSEEISIACVIVIIRLLVHKKHKKLNIREIDENNRTNFSQVSINAGCQSNYRQVFFAFKPEISFKKPLFLSWLKISLKIIRSELVKR